MSLGSFYLYLVNITHWYALWASLWLCCMTFSQDSRAAVLFQPAPVKQHIICDTKPKSLRCFCSLTEKMCLFAKLIIVGVCFTLWDSQWHSSFFQTLFMMTQNSVLLIFFSDVWASCFQVFSPHRNCSAVPVTSGFFFLPHSYSFSVVPRC